MLTELLKHKLTNSQLNSFLIEYEAIKLGLKTYRLNHYLVTISDENGNRAIFRRAAGPGVSYASDIATMNKDMVKRIWHLNDIPINPWRSLNRNQFKEALYFAEKHNWNIVVKPIAGSGGRDVHTNVRNKEQLKEALIRVAESRVTNSKYSGPNNILIEKKFIGNDYRFFIVNGDVVAVLNRKRPQITGDGVSTIFDLIERKKDERSSNPDLFSRPLLIDGEAHKYMADQNVNMDSVIDNGKKVILRGNANLSTGGESIDVTDTVPMKVKYLVCRSVESVPNLKTCAVDVFCKDIENVKDLSNENIVINEIETDAGMCIHHFPYQGKARNVAGFILKSIFGLQNERMSNYQHDFDDNKDLVSSIVYRMRNDYYDFFENNNLI